MRASILIAHNQIAPCQCYVCALPAPHDAQQHQMHLACVMRSCLHHRRPRLCRDTCLCRVTNAHGRISCMHVQYVSPVHSYHVQRAALPTTHISVSHTQPFWQLLPTYAYLSIPHAAFLAPNTHSRVFFHPKFNLFGTYYPPTRISPSHM
jgi:hypothetical protein